MWLATDKEIQVRMDYVSDQIKHLRGDDIKDNDDIRSFALGDSGDFFSNAEKRA